MSDIVVRSIEPGDVDEIARIHTAAFPRSGLTALGPEAVRRYYRWQLVGPHDSVSLVLCDRARILGFCFAGVFRGAMSGFLRRNRTYLALRVATHPTLLANEIVRQRMRVAWRVISGGRERTAPANGAATLPVRAFGVLAIAVDPACRRTGVGRRLMEEVECAALDRGFEIMSLTVEPNNGEAVRFYERLGWVRDAVEGRWHGRMRKQLAR